MRFQTFLAYDYQWHRRFHRLISDPDKRPLFDNDSSNWVTDLLRQSIKIRAMLEDHPRCVSLLFRKELLQHSLSSVALNELQLARSDISLRVRYSWVKQHPDEFIRCGLFGCSSLNRGKPPTLRDTGGVRRRLRVAVLAMQCVCINALKCKCKARPLVIPDKRVVTEKQPCSIFAPSINSTTDKADRL